MDILPRKGRKGEYLQIIYVEGDRCYIRQLVKCPALFSVWSIALHSPSYTNRATDFKADVREGRVCHHTPAVDMAIQQHRQSAELMMTFRGDEGNKEVLF